MAGRTPLYLGKIVPTVVRTASGRGRAMLPVVRVSNSVAVPFNRNIHQPSERARNQLFSQQMREGSYLMRQVQSMPVSPPVHQTVLQPPESGGNQAFAQQRREGSYLMRHAQSMPVSPPVHKTALQPPERWGNQAFPQQRREGSYLMRQAQSMPVSPPVHKTVLQPPDRGCNQAFPQQRREGSYLMRQAQSMPVHQPISHQVERGSHFAQAPFFYARHNSMPLDQRADIHAELQKRKADISQHQVQRRKSYAMFCFHQKQVSDHREKKKIIEQRIHHQLKSGTIDLVYGTSIYLQRRELEKENQKIESHQKKADFYLDKNRYHAQQAYARIIGFQQALDNQNAIFQRVRIHSNMEQQANKVRSHANPASRVETREKQGAAGFSISAPSTSKNKTQEESEQVKTKSLKVNKKVCFFEPDKCASQEVEVLKKKPDLTTEQGSLGHQTSPPPLPPKMRTKKR